MSRHKWPKVFVREIFLKTHVKYAKSGVDQASIFLELSGAVHEGHVSG